VPLCVTSEEFADVRRCEFVVSEDAGRDQGRFDYRVSVDVFFHTFIPVFALRMCVSNPTVTPVTNAVTYDGFISETPFLI
jgi:hypothetical protein